MVVARDAADGLDAVGPVPRGDYSLEGARIKRYSKPAPLHCHNAIAVTYAKVVDAAEHPVG